MKKNLLMMAAIMFGILMTFASCKDSKKSSKADADDEDDTEQVEKDGRTASKKDLALNKLTSFEDIEALEDLDMDDINIEIAERDQIYNDANKLLDVGLVDDVEAAIKDLQEKQIAAHRDRVLEEAQRQIDEYLGK